MFDNLYRLMKERGVTQVQAAKAIGVTARGFNKKLRETDFTSREMFAIQQIFFADKSIEEIFKR